MGRGALRQGVLSHQHRGPLAIVYLSDVDFSTSAPVLPRTVMYDSNLDLHQFTLQRAIYPFPMALMFP